MATDFYRRIEELFAQAVELPAAQRSAFLDQACAGDPRSRAEIESLLAHLDQAQGSCFHGQPTSSYLPPPDEAPDLLAQTGAPSAEEDDRVGQGVGPYTVEARLGEGGFGTIGPSAAMASIARRWP